MQLVDPNSARMLNGRVQEDDLILDPDLMNDGCESKCSIRRLSDCQQHHICSDVSAYLVILGALVSPREYFSPAIVIICPLEFAAEQLNDVSDSLEENALYALVQFCHPVIKVGVSLEVEPIDLQELNQSGASSKEGKVHTAAWIFPSSSRKASGVYGHVDSSSTDRNISLYKSITLFVLSYMLC